MRKFCYGDKFNSEWKATAVLWLSVMKVPPTFGKKLLDEVEPCPSLMFITEIKDPTD